MIFKEYNYKVETGELVSISLKKHDGIPSKHGLIIFNKRDLNGRFLEQYVMISENQFNSIDQNGNINNTYTIENSGEERIFIRDDGRKYFSFSGRTFEEVAEYIKKYNNADKILELLNKHPNAKNIIWTNKEGVESIYIIESQNDSI